MKFRTELIMELLKDQIISFKIENPEEYVWVDIVSIDSADNLKGCKLIFAGHSDENEWHFAFDRRSKVKNYAQHNHVIVDFETDIRNTIQVESIELAAKTLYDYTFWLHDNHITVIGVTGSVGKTTTVGMLEQLLKGYNKNVVRFYSKRIFPLSLFTHYINKINSETEYIVMEYSLFFSTHVGILAQLLPPKYAFILNILTIHQEERLGLYLREDIFSAKIKLFIPTKTITVFLHEDLQEYIQFYENIPYEYYSSFMKNFIKSIPPTERTFQMLGLVKKFQEVVLENNIDMFINVLKSYIPVEQRIIQIKIVGKDIYFHGETSTAERLLSFLESDTECIFFIDEINFSEGNPYFYRDKLKELFERKTTFVLDTEINRGKLQSLLDLKNILFLSKKDFLEKFESSFGYIVYHKALFVRQKELSIQDYFATFFI